MTTIASLESDVYTITNRPDLISETALAVRKATLKAHLADTYPADLQIVTVTAPALINATDYRYTIPLNSAPIVRFRRLLEVRQYNSPPTSTDLTFAQLDSDGVFDSYNAEFFNYWYVAGQNVVIRAISPVTTFRISYYNYPDTSDATYSSWIADMYPSAITDEAAAIIFKLIGKENEYQRFQLLTRENYALIQAAQIY